MQKISNIENAHFFQQTPHLLFETLFTNVYAHYFQKRVILLASTVKRQSANCRDDEVQVPLKGRGTRRGVRLWVRGQFVWVLLAPIAEVELVVLEVTSTCLIAAVSTELLTTNRKWVSDDYNYSTEFFYKRSFDPKEAIRAMM